VSSTWHPTLRYFWEFLAIEALLLNPVFFVAMVWATVAFWKRRQENPLALYLFCLGGLVFLDIWSGRSTRASCPTGPRPRWCRCAA